MAILKARRLSIQDPQSFFGAVLRNQSMEQLLQTHDQGLRRGSSDGIASKIRDKVKAVLASLRGALLRSNLD